MIAQDSTDIQQEILNRVDVVAQKINEIAPEAWKILIRQQYIEAYTSIAGVIVSGAILTVLGTFWQKSGKPLGDWIIDIDKSFPRSCGLFLLVAGMVVVFLLTAADVVFFAVPKILNPEYYALMELKP